MNIREMKDLAVSLKKMGLANETISAKLAIEVAECALSVLDEEKLELYQCFSEFWDSIPSIIKEVEEEKGKMASGFVVKGAVVYAALGLLESEEELSHVVMLNNLTRTTNIYTETDLKNAQTQRTLELAQRVEELENQNDILRTALEELCKKREKTNEKVL